jgi:hypothetical protein
MTMDALRQALVGDPEMPDCIRPLSWLDSMIDECKRRGPSADEEDPDAYWTMVQEVESLLGNVRSALKTAE